MELKRTPLYEVHAGLGARFVEFAGWEMPVRYKGVMEEHRAVRSSCGLFDVSHMGEIEIRGVGALEAVELITANRASGLKDRQCQYTFILNRDGGVVDDVVLYRFSAERFILCVNASNTDKAYGWIRENVSGMADVRDVSLEYAQFALQGPGAEKILKPHVASDISRIKYYHFEVTEVANELAVVSRTGYTGEDGFEIYLEPSMAIKVWKVIMFEGKKLGGVTPCGLGARDTLRLEMGYPLYGFELNEDITPLEAGLGRFVCLGKERFIGKEALVRQAADGVEKTLVGLEMDEPGIPRPHYKVFKDNDEAGEITSGSFSPSLERAICMGYVKSSLKAPGTAVEIEVRGKRKKAHVVRPPFYHRPGGRPGAEGGE
ncbi:MAG: glycine cleavage system aminomethyltransferase GcvT [Deltaproteobacteria bacterium]|nr:glycine cleavage system aminomethyltransferase GcvT [Deltaproteobacteria bacterium]